jgi:lipoprotein NlpI
LIGLACAGAAAQNPRAVLDRAVDDFAAGRLAAAAAGFDEVAALVPRAAPQLWQRGIALYYVGRYQDCREQFESHRLVNPNDVENAAWHFLCVARGDSADAALAALLPVGPDSRAPMREIYEMFRGELAPAEVMTAGERATARGRASGLFFAHLYVGLYYEALGNDTDARTHLEAAADARYAPAGGYMHMVARVHVDQLDRAAPR